MIRHQLHDSSRNAAARGSLADLRFGDPSRRRDSPVADLETQATQQTGSLRHTSTDGRDEVESVVGRRSSVGVEPCSSFPKDHEQEIAEEHTERESLPYLVMPHHGGEPVERPL